MASRRRLVLAIVAAVTAALVVLSVRDDGDHDGLAEPVEVALRSYRVVYDLEELSQEREETVVVRRPYESRRSSRRDGEVFSATIVNADGLWELVGEPSSAWRLLDPGRRRSEGDVRPLGALLLLVDQGLAERREDEVVAGRPCSGFRVREPIGAVATEAPTHDEHVELCVDRAGVLLRERWVSDGQLVRTREAIRFEESPRLGPDAFRPRPRLDDGRAAPFTVRRELPFTEEIEQSLDVGFDLPATIFPDGGIALLTLDPSGHPIGGTAIRFFRRGHDLVEVEEVESSGVNGDRGFEHDVPVGEGRFETDLRTVTLRVALPHEITVVFRGPNLELLDVIARSMSLRERAD